MFNKSIARVAFATALIFAFSACGDDSSGGPSFDGEASSGDTENAADNAVNMMTDITYALNFGSPNVLLAASASAKRLEAEHPGFGGVLSARIAAHGIMMPGLTVTAGAPIQFSSAPGCTIESSGTNGDPFDPYDGNENGIPDDWHVKYVCVEHPPADSTVTTTIEASAKENTASLHGYSSHLSYDLKISDGEGNSVGGQFSMTEELDIRASGVTNDLTSKTREFSTQDGTTEEGQAGEERHVSFDPDGTIVLGDDLPDGDLSFSGKRWYANTDDVSLSFTIKTTTPLAYSAACFDATEPPFTDGTIVGTLNGNSHSASYTVHFTSCGNYTVEVSNTTDPVVSAVTP